MAYNIYEKGKWSQERVPSITTDFVVLDSQQTAVHASLIYYARDNKWQVLYYRADLTEGSPAMIKSKIWDPTATTDSTKIVTKEIPNWPSSGIGPPSDPPRLFCGGHVHFLDTDGSGECSNFTRW